MPSGFSSLHDVFAFFASPGVTWRPMGVDVFHTERVPDSLRRAFDDAVTADLKIRIDDRDIHVHKVWDSVYCCLARVVVELTVSVSASRRNARFSLLK